MKTFLEYASVKASDGAHIDEDGNLMDLSDDSVIEKLNAFVGSIGALFATCLLYTSPSPRDRQKSRMPSSA